MTSGKEPGECGIKGGERFVVTLDGPAGVGKSTLAKRVAEELGVAYLDTGAMFRTIALNLARQGALEQDHMDDQALAQLLQEFVFTLEGAGEASRLLCNGVAVGDEIRTEEAGMMAAKAGKIPQIRDFLKTAQQKLGLSFSLVAEGRDMGTVVFPGARCKFFLDADVEVRAERRLNQLHQMGVGGELRQIADQIRLRDEQDRNRAIAPLRPAVDAHVIDTSSLDLDGVFSVVMGHIRADGNRSAIEPPVIRMRRKDRAMPPEETVALLERGSYGTLALTDASGWPYAVPLSYVFMDGSLYFHSALTGRKVDAIVACDKASFTVVDNVEAVYEGNFTTRYESAMVFGRVLPVEDEDEKFRSLVALARKYLPDHMDKAEQDIRHSFSRTAVYRLVPEQMTGKAKKGRKA